MSGRATMIGCNPAAAGIAFRDCEPQPGGLPLSAQPLPGRVGNLFTDGACGSAEACGCLASPAPCDTGDWTSLSLSGDSSVACNPSGTLNYTADLADIAPGSRIVAARTRYSGTSPSPPGPGITFTVEDNGGVTTGFSVTVNWAADRVALLNDAIAEGAASFAVTATGTLNPSHHSNVMSRQGFDVWLCPPILS